jgi:predicted deoxyguanosinetriphosphate triphosphohydrolase
MRKRASRPAAELPGRSKLHAEIVRGHRDKERSRCNRAYATLSEDSRGRVRDDERARLDHRSAFALDRDRILYCKAFFRLSGKTQVFMSPRNPLISNRMTHTLHVAQISRAVARILDLNEDLAEAIALGHDVGHPPFGHRGEQILGELSQRHVGVPFHHNTHSLRILDTIEKGGSGLNLSYEVREGIVRHCGETDSRCFRPGKPCDDLVKDCFEANPSTLEGCVVKLCDRIGYVGKDIEDATASGIISEADLPERVTRVLGKTNGQIIDTLVMDVIANFREDAAATGPGGRGARARRAAGRRGAARRGGLAIRLSQPISDSLNSLISDFNYPRIYMSQTNTRYARQTEKMLSGLFQSFLEELDEMSLPDEEQSSLGDFQGGKGAARSNGGGMAARRSLGELGEAKGRAASGERLAIIRANLARAAPSRSSMLYFLSQMDEGYWAVTGNAQMVIDYISLMTDEMATSVYESLTIPRPVV